MSVETWIVLVIGIATVLSQLYAAKLADNAAKRGDKVATKQLAASEAALRNERQAVLVFARTFVTNDHAIVTVHNGGRHAAIDLRFMCLDSGGAIVASACTPMVEAASEQNVTVKLADVAQRDALMQSEKVSAEWADGQGARTEPDLPLLVAE